MQAQRKKNISNSVHQGQELSARSGKSMTPPLYGISFIDHQPVQRQVNKTGMPDQLKSGIESLSGMDMSDVKVHYNSSQPAQLQAHAFAQGSQIHLAPGQEKHLPHEAWHVVQQKQGRVAPTTQLKSAVSINDDEHLEKEADVMGQQALQKKSMTAGTQDAKPPGAGMKRVTQRKVVLDEKLVTELKAKFTYLSAEEIIEANESYKGNGLAGLESILLGLNQKKEQNTSSPTGSESETQKETPKDSPLKIPEVGTEKWDDIENLEKQVAVRDENAGIPKRIFNSVTGLLSRMGGAITNISMSAVNWVLRDWITRKFGITITELNAIITPGAGTYGAIHINSFRFTLPPKVSDGTEITLQSGHAKNLFVYAGKDGIYKMCTDLIGGKIKSLTDLNTQLDLESLTLTHLNIKEFKPPAVKGGEKENTGNIILNLQVDGVRLVFSSNLFASIYQIISSREARSEFRKNPVTGLLAVLKNANGALRADKVTGNIVDGSWTNTGDKTHALIGDFEASNLLAAATGGESLEQIKGRASIGSVRASGAMLGVSDFLHVENATATGIAASYNNHTARATVGKIAADKITGEAGPIEGNVTNLNLAGVSAAMHHTKDKKWTAGAETGALTANGMSVNKKGSDPFSLQTGGIEVLPVKAHGAGSGITKEEMLNASGRVISGGVNVKEVAAQADRNTATVDELNVHHLEAGLAVGKALGHFAKIEATGIKAHSEEGGPFKDINEYHTLTANANLIDFKGVKVDTDKQRAKTLNVGSLAATGLTGNLRSDEIVPIDPKNISKGGKELQHQYSAKLDKAEVRSMSARVSGLEDHLPLVEDVSVHGLELGKGEVIDDLLKKSLLEVTDINLKLNDDSSGNGTVTLELHSAVSKSVEAFPGIVAFFTNGVANLEFRVTKGMLDLATVKLDVKRNEKSQSIFKPDSTLVGMLGSSLLNKHVARVTTTKYHLIGSNEVVPPRLKIGWSAASLKIEERDLGFSDKQLAKNPVLIPHQASGGGEAGGVHLKNLLQLAIQKVMDENLSKKPRYEKHAPIKYKSEIIWQELGVLLQQSPEQLKAQKQVAEVASILEQLSQDGLVISNATVTAVLVKSGFDLRSKETPKGKQPEPDKRPSARAIDVSIDSLEVGATTGIVDVRKLIATGTAKKSERSDKPTTLAPTPSDKLPASTLSLPAVEPQHSVVHHVQYDTGRILHAQNSCYLSSIVHIFASHNHLTNLFQNAQHAVALENDPLIPLPSRQRDQAIGLAIQQNSGIRHAIATLRDPHGIVTIEEIGNVMKFLGLVGNILQLPNGAASKKKTTVTPPEALQGQVKTETSTLLKQDEKETAEKTPKPTTVSAEPTSTAKVEPLKVNVEQDNPATWGVQQDASEILSEILRYLRPGNALTIQQDSTLGPDATVGFAGSTTQTTENTLQLPITANINTIPEALTNYSAVENNIPYLGGHVTKQVRFSRLPQVLTLVLKRFDFNPLTGASMKITRQIEAPIELTIPQQCLTGPLVGQVVRYKLIHFTQHEGDAGGGHYVSFAKNAHDEWYKHNDIGGARSAPGLGEFQRNLYTGYIYIYERLP